MCIQVKKKKGADMTKKGETKQERKEEKKRRDKMTSND